MPFRSRKYTVRKAGRFKRFLRGAYSVGKTAYKAYKIASKIARLVNVETKHLDTAVTGGFNSSGAVYSLNIMGQGDTSITRNGDSIKALSIDGNAYFQTGSEDNVCRILLVLDKQNAGAIPAITDILSAATCVAHQNIDQMRRFHILDDRIFKVDTGSELKTMTFRHTWANLHLYYSDGDADAAALKDNALFVVVVASSDPATDPQITSSWRLNFTDN